MFVKENLNKGKVSFYADKYKRQFDLLPFYGEQSGLKNVFIDLEVKEV